ncbi:DNA-binding NarL/FixJ family response regulator [Actimicrobium sp. GrIS 1.19]|uniref:response regulator transcription factor n=1 Tax=Actimicrobium sp. GrIS 1.19 TaxID=3071708 RepID=UPI002E065E44|nr:DNA-binding NarL/FixJ family response regulator [Actimicrobium sp. GrIS 1.19]
MSATPIRVMLVDDHLVVRNGVRLMLDTAHDIRVTGEAGSASEAMQLVEAQTFDVALVDIALPGKNGLELLKQLRAERPKMAVLILSMYSEEVYAVRTLRYGGAGYLTKDCPANVMVEAVRTAATGRKYVSSGLVERLADMMGGSAGLPHDTLSNREMEVFKLLAAGVTLVDIASQLHLSPSTVTTYRARILEKTGLKGNTGLARYALEHGLVK